MRLRYVIIALFLLLVTSPVLAADITTSIGGVSSIDANSEFTLTLKVKGDNIWGLSGSISYDKSKLSIVSSSGENGFTAMLGTGFSLDTANGKSGSFDILKITFKATKSFMPGESTTVSFSNMTGATDSSKLTVANAQKTIKVNVPKSGNNDLSSLKIDESAVSGFSSSKTNYDLGTTTNSELQISASTQDTKAKISGIGKKKLDYGKNTFKIVVTAENGKTKTYSIVINRKDDRSTNNFLKSLEVKNAKINFAKSNVAYNVVVENDVSFVEINAIAEDDKSKVTGTGKKTLKNYLNTFNVVVTAENGTKRTYIINISRKDENGNAGELSKNNKLKSLEIVGYSLDFKPDTLKYNLTVKNVVNKVDIIATLADSKSIMKINNLSELKVGENKITIEVMSQNGDTRTYEIIVTRKNDIPIVKISELKDTIIKTTANEIEVEIKDDENVISTSILRELKGRDIQVNVNKYENDKNKYVWIIDGKNIKKAMEFNTLVTFENNNEIDELTNYVQSYYLNFAHNGELPGNTKFKVFVGDKYNDDEKLKLYYYDKDNNEMKLEKEDLVVKSGYVEFELEHCSKYILTKSILGKENNSFDIRNIVIFIESFVIVGLIVCMFMKFRNTPVNATVDDKKDKKKK